MPAWDGSVTHEDTSTLGSKAYRTTGGGSKVNWHSSN